MRNKKSGKNCISFYDYLPPMGSGKRYTLCKGDKFAFQTHAGGIGDFVLTSVSKKGKIRMRELSTGAVRNVSSQTFSKGLFVEDKRKYIAATRRR